jgi:hypothetical protein
MKLADARQIYYGATDSLSQVNRQLDFAGIGVIWILKTGESKVAAIPFDQSLLLPLTAFVLAIALDLLQYIYKSAAWGIFHRIKEKTKEQPEQIDKRHRHLFNRTGETGQFNSDFDFKAPAAINWPTLVAFWGKVIFTVFSYTMLLRYLAGKLF